MRGEYNFMQVLYLDFGKKGSGSRTVKGGCLEYSRGRTGCREIADSKGEKDKKRSKGSLGGVRIFWYSTDKECDPKLITCSETSSCSDVDSQNCFDGKQGGIF